jgi:hypothetical protein
MVNPFKKWQGNNPIKYHFSLMLVVFVLLAVLGFVASLFVDYPFYIGVIAGGYTGIMIAHIFPFNWREYWNKYPERF